MIYPSARSKNQNQHLEYPIIVATAHFNKPKIVYKDCGCGSRTLSFCGRGFLPAALQEYLKNRPPPAFFKFCVGCERRGRERAKMFWRFLWHLGVYGSCVGGKTQKWAEMGGFFPCTDFPQCRAKRRLGDSNS